MPQRTVLSGPGRINAAYSNDANVAKFFISGTVIHTYTNTVRAHHSSEAVRAAKENAATS